MKTSRVRLAVAGAAVAMLAFAGVAYAGNGTLDRVQQHLKDGSCQTTTVAADQDRLRTQDPAHDAIQQKLKDGSCQVAADHDRCGRRPGPVPAEAHDGSCQVAADQDRVRLQDPTHDRIQDHLRDGQLPDGRIDPGAVAARQRSRNQFDVRRRSAQRPAVGRSPAPFSSLKRQIPTG